jgi:hypothetical protein
MEAIVRRAVKDKGSVEVLSHNEGLALEEASAPRRQDQRSRAGTTRL